jgi:recombinational DNA repair protein RecR
LAGAADAAALAAADAASGVVDGAPCERAAEIAVAAGSELAACELDGVIATVTVAGAFGRFTATLRHERPAELMRGLTALMCQLVCMVCFDERTPPLATGKKLVIVESPTKMKSIQGYLGDDYEVLSSVGHIRDLASKKDIPADKKTAYGKYSIDIDNDFDPYYVVNDRKTKTVAELKRALKTADEVLLATDEDREGEAIAWHLLEVLKPKVPSTAWCSTRSPRTPSARRSTTPANSTSRSSMRRRPAACSTASRLGRPHPCCGAKSAAAVKAPRSAQVACSPQPPAWSSTVSVSAWHSSRPAIGTSKRSPSSRPSPSPPVWLASTVRLWHAARTSTTAVS